MNILTEKASLAADLLRDIRELAGQNRVLREKLEYLERIENKLKSMGGIKWMTSRYYPAICSVRVGRSSIINQIEKSLNLTNKLAFYVATLNERQIDYETSDRLDIDELANYFTLNENYEARDTRHIKQRTSAWMAIRKDAMVTGSTCNAALGLGKLKEQQSHYDQVVLKKDKPRIPDEIMEMMKYGVEHEKDAVATVCAKVIPSMFPCLQMYEEGCVAIEHNDFKRFMVVSPDGSLKAGSLSSTQIAYENKCKAPTSYSKHAYYNIPHYYIPQLLSEMSACNCDKLLFTCRSEESMSVFEVKNNPRLWEKCWRELISVYAAEDRSRPKRFSKTRKQLQDDIIAFQSTNTTLIGEFPSTKVVSRNTTQLVSDDTHNPYIRAGKCSRQERQVELSDVQNTLETLKMWFIDTYECLPSVASEILVFMVSDLDRMYNMESENAHIVAYAMKGPSMRNDILRKMIHDVISTCEKHDLKIVLTSSDGQWHQYGFTDDVKAPLTVHQLMKKVWNSLQSNDRSKLRTTLKKHYTVHSLDDLRYQKVDGKIYITGHKHNMPLDYLNTVTGKVQNSGDNEPSDVVPDDHSCHESTHNKENQR